MRYYRPTFAEINLANLAYNFRKVKSHLSRKIKILVTVKADAYGHGLIPVSRKLVSCGVDYLGVASIDEGIILRNSGIRVPILILGMILKNDIDPLFNYNLTPTVCDLGLAKIIDKKAARLKKIKAIHIKVDTGMGRIGVMHYDAEGLVRDISKLKHLKIEGLFTHFAFADINKEFTLYQIKLFNKLIARLGSLGLKIPLLHTANSIGLIKHKESHFNMVRPGLVIYGLYPDERLKIKLKPVLSLRTRAVFVKDLPKGYGVSYGHEYTTSRRSRIVTLPIGYGDGYPRNLSNRAPVLIKGKRFTVSGRICMDQIMVDVGKTKVKAGDEAILIGTQGRKSVTTEELARLSGTIPYEIVCGLGSRIPRIFHE
jgi:alanine racemase